MDSRRAAATLTAGLALLLAGGAVTGEVRAQEASGGTGDQEEGSYAIPPDSAAPATGLRFVGVDSLELAPRDPFVYPVDGRRDPFRPPAARSGAGSEFGALKLVGILYAPETGSVAVVVNRGTGKRHRLRVGDQVAGARLVEVGRDRAVFRVTAPGASRRTVLRLQDSQERELHP